METREMQKLLDTWLLLMDQIRPRHLNLPTSLPHLTMLRWLIQRGPFTVSQIAELADVSPSAITQAARKLEREGFVQRRRDETDQRVVWIDVTRKAREAVKVLEAAQRERLAAMLSVLSESQQNALRDLLEATAAPLHQNPPEGEVSRE